MVDIKGAMMFRSMEKMMMIIALVVLMKMMGIFSLLVMMVFGSQDYCQVKHYNNCGFHNMLLDTVHNNSEYLISLTIHI